MSTRTTITEKDAKKAGELTNELQWTDDELKQVIKFIRIVVAFLEGKGPRWSLATSPLRKELEIFKGFVEARKRK